MSIDVPDSVVAPSSNKAIKLPFWERSRRALGPSLPGIMLDLVDALSLTRYAGPIVSFPVGLLVGVWLSTYYPFSLRWKCLIALGSGLYTLTPGTEAIPLATILTCLGRFIEAAPTYNVQSPSEATAQSASDDPAVASQSSSPTPSARGRAARTDAKCPECGSSALIYGQVGQRFWPAGSSVWTRGHEVNAFVCRDCGFVGHYLSSADLESLDRH